MLDILYEDSHLLVATKPAGLATQGSDAEGLTFEALVRRHLRPDDPGAVYIGTVHRLDRPVSGVMAWAKTPKAARRLAAQFAGREARKEYWAVVEGTPALAGATWDDWLCVEDTGLGAVQVCQPGTPRSRLARTHVANRHAAGLPSGCAWLVLNPETGRRHQLRVQAAARGTPVLGDRAYGASRGFAEGAIALHARALTLRHPILERVQTFEAPVPSAWAEHGIALAP